MNWCLSRKDLFWMDARKKNTICRFCRRDMNGSSKTMDEPFLFEA